MKRPKIAIVGAGLTGLVAAKELSNKGIEVSVFEKLNQPGGRMRTEEIEGWKLDVGFQVLLTAYPYLKKHVTLSELENQKLEAAATVFREGRTTAVGDPFRVKNILWKTAFSDIGSVKDKWLIFQLKRYVDQRSIDTLFEEKNDTTIGFLKKFGFSEQIINRFFKPFFGGIFLENELTTSSRMFLFVFKMFSEGNAAIPKTGVGAVGKQLEAKIKNANVNYNCEVSKIEGQSIYFENGDKESFDFVINTIPNYGKRKSHDLWQNCYNMYFEHSNPAIIKEARIGLNANKNQLINNIFYPSVSQNPKGKEGKALISVTVLDAKELKDHKLVEKVIQELKNDFNVRDPRLVKMYEIPYALPKMNPPVNAVSFDKNAKTFELGDFLMNGSQNAACKIGEEIASHIVSLVDL
ncbi:FAD-dependent oxidoreductase [Brumimicrobium oceani]|uniref:Oxidoreductase n=1 Tax=Brumimicrobium oceani TaxID=2100725 RepID=A0A2U2XGF2_9FLAO|nr:FAD-dependent oxidoreductase [Brumimicrobium oceani]PWH86874.1 oxidoreductase [Brumimicrobium oceani]